jgi:hypothetical protein
MAAPSQPFADIVAQVFFLLLGWKEVTTSGALTGEELLESGDLECGEGALRHTPGGSVT